MSNQAKTQAITTQHTTSEPTQLFPNLGDLQQGLKLAKNPQLWVAIGVAITWYLMRDKSGGKGKLSTGGWGGKAQLNTAKKIALKEIKKPKKNAASLWVNTPPDIAKKLETYFKTIAGKNKYKGAKTLYFPDVQQSTIVIGQAGSGKTYSFIDPMIMSALKQFFSLMLYDFKYPGQAKRHAVLAKMLGYEVYLLAPSFPESHSLNILDFIKGTAESAASENAVAAEQLAEVIIQNCRTGDSGGDPFFEQAGMMLVQGLFLITKWIGEYTDKNRKPDDKSTENYCDLLTTACLINMPNLAARIQYCLDKDPNNLKISRWTLQSFAQIIATHGGGDGNEANKTETSIVSTASAVFGKFIKKDIVGAFCRPSTIPTEIDGKKMVIFGMNQEMRYSIGPLLAAAIHMMVSGNIVHSKPRKSPLIVALDEVPTIFLPALPNWEAEARSAGFCGIIGAQNRKQLKEKYGENMADVIFANAATKIICNPGEPESAKIYSEFIGKQEITVKNKSRSGGKNASTTTSSNQQVVDLLAPEELLRFDKGDAVAISSGYKDKKKRQAFIPVRMDVKLSDRDLAEGDYAESRFDNWIRRQIKENPQLSDPELQQMFQDRAMLVESLFPEPPVEKK
jgi:type IV secretory pathway TraG/TraD family ATPase VirD4